MSLNQFIKGFVLVAILGYLFTLNSSEARGWPDEQQQQQQQDAILRQQLNDIQAQYGNIQNAMQNGANNDDSSSNVDRLDSDDDEEDDDGVQQLQPASLPIQQLGSQLYQNGVQYPNMAGQQQQQQQQPSASDLRTAASKHYGHHKHGAKGWLDMGAWTGKKGAFGWYDKHPVGKGK